MAGKDQHWHLSCYTAGQAAQQIDCILCQACCTHSTWLMCVCSSEQQVFSSKSLRTLSRCRVLTEPPQVPMMIRPGSTLRWSHNILRNAWISSLMLQKPLAICFIRCGKLLIEGTFALSTANLCCSCIGLCPIFPHSFTACSPIVHCRHGH